MSQQNLYTVPEDTKQALKKFRFASARKDTVQAIVVKISSAQSIVIEETEEFPITSIEELIEELPDNSPRFVCLSYPITLKDGRKTTPYVMVYYRPPTTTQNNRMAYAGAVELVRNEAGVNKVVEIEDSEELEEIESLIV